VVVGVAADSNNRPTAFRWTRADGMEAIAENGKAIAVSADGGVVLGQQDQPLARGFRWTRALGAMIFEPLPGDVATTAFAVSADGATVLGNSFRSDGTSSLFVWTAASGVRVVDNLPGYTGCLAGLELTHGFIVAGSCYDQTGRSEPYVWMGQDHLLSLGPADALGDYDLSGPIAVSVDGSVALGRTAAVEHVSRLYRWTQTDGFEFIELPEGYTSHATAPGHRTMSDDGAVVVGWLTGIARRSFLWSEGTGTVVLSPLDGHDVSEVSAVSADGTVAVGGSFRLGSLGQIEDWTAVYWGADGAPHRIADELRANGLDVGWDAIGNVHAAYAPLGVFGYGRKDEVSVNLGWRARLPERLNAVAQ
jgi:uncharacterized membrane protein